MADSGKFVLGICSGFQMLARATDIGRLSSTPIMREGLGLLDVKFQPLICTDRVTATVVEKSFMTDSIGETVTGFHCHTYGKIVPNKDARPIIVSHIQRVNYRSNPQDFASGFTTKEGNVSGILTHALLDENPVIIQSIVKSLGISAKELQEIRNANSRLVAKMRCEIGISTNIKLDSKPTFQKETPVVLFTTATGSGSARPAVAARLARCAAGAAGAGTRAAARPARRVLPRARAARRGRRGTLLRRRGRNAARRPGAPGARQRRRPRGQDRVVDRRRETTFMVQVGRIASCAKWQISDRTADDHRPGLLVYEHA